MIGPRAHEHPAPFQTYLDLVPEADVLAILEDQLEALSALGAAVPSEQETFAYATGKWTIRELVGHLGDVERVFGFRAFSFSRFDRAALPGFDENDYVVKSAFNATPLRDLVDEFRSLRQANLHMLRALGDAQWDAVGNANGKQITVRALAFVMAGHVRHHLGVLRERYGIEGVKS